MSMAQFMDRNYAETIRLSWGDSPNRKVILAASYTLLDRPEKAAEIAKELLEAQPDFNLSQWKYGRLWKSVENRTRLFNAAMQAGIPEFPKDQ